MEQNQPTDWDAGARVLRERNRDLERRIEAMEDQLKKLNQSIELANSIYENLVNRIQNLSTAIQQQFANLEMKRRK